MIKIEETYKVIDFLESLGYLTLNIRGVIRNTSLDLFTDDPDKPGGFCIMDRYFCYVYALNEDFMKIFSEWTADKAYLGFSGANKVVRDYYYRHGLIQWKNPCHQLHYTGSYFNDQPLEELKLEEAAYVDDHYEYNNDNSLEEIQEAILKRPTSCLRIDGKLVSFVLLHKDDSIGYMYTLPEYRKHGYAYLLTKDIIDKTLESERLPYVQIVHGNDKSVGLAEKAGFEKHGDVYWFGIVNTKGQDFQSILKAYQDRYGKARSVTTRLTCEMRLERLEVTLHDQGIEYEDRFYPVNWTKTEEGCFVDSQGVPDRVLLSAVMDMMDEPWQIAVLNQEIRHSAVEKVD